MLPKVSIVIPVYNGDNYLKQAIDCALNQSYPNIEVLVVNDGSNDGGKTEQIALSYGDRVRYFYKPNGGVSSALNFGIKKMTGEYFSWLSHDDCYSEDKVLDGINLLLEFNQIGKKTVAFTGGHFIDSKSEKLYSFPKVFDDKCIYSGLETVQNMTLKGTLNGCCMLIPRDAFTEAGYFNEDLRYSQDTLMWYNIFLLGYNIISDNKDNVMYRFHGNQASQTRRDLYEHDAKYIAEVLAEPLMKADEKYMLYYQYVKRITKYQCKDAIEYMIRFANEHNLFSNKQKLYIKICMIKGAIRYRLSNLYKKLLILAKS